MPPAANWSQAAWAPRFREPAMFRKNPFRGEGDVILITAFLIVATLAIVVAVLMKYR